MCPVANRKPDEFRNFTARLPPHILPRRVTLPRSGGHILLAGFGQRQNVAHELVSLSKLKYLPKIASRFIPCYCPLVHLNWNEIDRIAIKQISAVCR
jgi:hypothetical protein